MNEVARNIKKHRSRLRLSQEELAERLHTTRQTISNWERGQSNPSTEDLIALSQVFQITVDDLIYPQRETSQRFLGERPSRTVWTGVLLFLLLRLCWLALLDRVLGAGLHLVSELAYYVVVTLGLITAGCARWIVLELRKR